MLVEMKEMLRHQTRLLPSVFERRGSSPECAWFEIERVRTIKKRRCNWNENKAWAGNKVVFGNGCAVGARKGEARWS